MSEEEKAIELLKEEIKELENKVINSYYESDRKLYAEYSIAYKKILNLIENQQQELQLKDKVIDEMSAYIDVAFSNAQLSRLLKREVLPLEIYKHDIKQYFINKVKGE